MTKPIRGWISLNNPMDFFRLSEFNESPVAGFGLVDLVPVVESKSRKCLTRRQREILEFCETCVREEQHFPALRDIGKRFAIKSPNGVTCHIKALERKGFLKHAAPGKSSAWSLV